MRIIHINCNYIGTALHQLMIENMDKLQGKIVFDTRKCCNLPGTYRL